MYKEIKNKKTQHTMSRGACGVVVVFFFR